MGVTWDVRCADCGANAPELGDFGHMGLPSASPDERSGELQNFGYLFVGFRAIGVVTGELVAFLRFLIEHDGHRLVTLADGEEETFDDDFEDDEWEDDELWDEDEKPSAALAAKMDALFAELAASLAEVPDGKFVVGHYAIDCKDCDDSFQTEFTEALQPVSELEITDARAALFLKIVERNEESFYRSQPFSPEDIEGIGGFLSEHQGHAVRAHLVPKAQSA